jgi:hippurate hydrolase
MKQIEGGGASPDLFVPLINDPTETAFIADVAADLVGEVHVDRHRSLIMGSEDFARMLEACPGAYIFIGNGDTVSSRPFHNPHYDFNDEALPIGASLFARSPTDQQMGEGSARWSNIAVIR